jgi:ribosomal-protein-alanine N-acetyltransferase
VLREDCNLPLIKSFEISEMSLSDMDEVLEIENLSFTTPWSKDLFLKEIHSEFSKIFVAQSNHLGQHKVLGYIYLWFVDEEMHILNLACHPDFRRGGVARGLLEHSLSLSFKIGMKIALLDVRESNHEALSLYRKYSFKPIGVTKGYYSDTKEDAIVMLLEMKSIPSFKNNFASYG